jgi:hypothetical protein
VLEPKLPKLTVTLAAGAPAGTTVRCDGRLLTEGELGAPIPVDPGEHSCVAIATGRAQQAQSVTVKEATSTDLVVTIGAPLPKGESKTEGTKVTAGGDATKRTLGWVSLGVGAAGLALAGISGLVLIGEKSTVDSGCQGKTNCNADALSAISANKTWVPINTVAWIVGAVGVGAGVFLLVTSKSDPAASAPIARVGIGAIGGGVGASTQVAF